MAAGTITTKGLNNMVDGIGQETGLYLVATDISENYSVAIAVTFAAAVSGSCAMSGGSRTLTIASGKTIDIVQLSTTTSYSTTLALSNVTLNEAFPNGGDLIIETFTITATST